MRRHDLLRVAPCAWRAMLRDHPGLETLPLVADWAACAWPVIVRRHASSDTRDAVAAALPLPPCYGKRRVGFCLVSDVGLTASPPVYLRDAAATAPEAWQATIAALLELGASIGTSPRVFGALLWQHLTGLAYLTATSDLDLLWEVKDAAAAPILIAGLSRVDGESPVRIDGELVLPDGGGVNWRELAQSAVGRAEEVLVKTLDGVDMRSASGLFLPVAPLPMPALTPQAA